MSTTIQALIEESLSSGVFTARQENRIFALIQEGVYSSTDLEAIDQLIEALTERDVVSGY